MNVSGRGVSVFTEMWCALAIFICLTTSCTFSPRADNTPQDRSALSDSTHPSELHSLYIVNEDKLRLRKYPDRRSGIQSALSYNEIVHFLGEQTDFEDQVGKYSAPWLHVRRVKDKRQGWVFGHEEFIQPFEEASTLKHVQQSYGGPLTLFTNWNRLRLSETLGDDLPAFKPGWRFSGYCCADSTGAMAYCRFRAIHPDPETRKWKMLHCIWDPKHPRTLRCDSTLFDPR